MDIYIYIYTSVLPSISIDEEVQRQRCTVGIGSCCGSSNEASFSLAAVVSVQTAVHASKSRRGRPARTRVQGRAGCTEGQDEQHRWVYSAQLGVRQARRAGRAGAQAGQARRQARQCVRQEIRDPWEPFGMAKWSPKGSREGPS